MNAKQQKQAVFSLHRYYMWCDQMKAHFEQIALEHGRINDLYSPEGAKIFMYMSYWYAGLYVVTEGWKQLDLADPRVDLLRSSTKHLALLKRYRHGVFHFQRNYFDVRFRELMETGKESVVWIGDLHEALGAFFLQWIDKEKLKLKKNI